MKQVDREIGDMISALTRRLAHLQKKPMDGANIHHHHQEDMEEEEEEDGHGAGVGIITMAGTNEGATMRGEMSMSMDQEDYKSGIKQDQSSPFTSYLNNNVQSVNNSIMVGGGYSANDPGIHLDVDDHYEGEPGNKKKNKNKKDSSGSDDSS